MNKRRALCGSALVVLAMALLSSPAPASFSGTDLVIPASARQAGASPSQFYSTLWVTNPGAAAANVQLRFLRRDTSNTSPATVSFVLNAGETKKYENVVGDLFGLPSASGAIRVTADREVFASSRTYNLPPGSDIRDANGLFFAGIPRSFALATGDTAQLQGVSQGGTEDFRYNFGLVEVGGEPATVHVVVRNSNGNQIGAKDYPLLAFEPKQFAVTDAAPDIASSNSRIEATVTSATGRVIVYATGIANGSQDSIGFEMGIPAPLAGGGVTTLNGLTGAVVLAAGSNIALTPAGNTITISATGGGLGLPYNGSAGTSGTAAAFTVVNSGSGVGISGQAGSGWGVYGRADSGVGVVGFSAGTGVYAESAGSGPGLYATSATSFAIRGKTGAGSGFNVGNPVDLRTAVWGDSETSVGVLATSKNAFGGALRAQTFAPSSGRGVEAYATGSGATAVYAVASTGATQAGYFQGSVQVNGALSKSSGSFKIDHPTDPANRYLYHSFVESPDMMNVYNGNVVLDARGEATVTMPEWFESLNSDFRYQLTCLGGFSPVFVADEIAGNTFRIAGGRPGQKVSWQVTGIRRDAWAEAHRVPVEEWKAERERGYYLHPELFGQPEEKGVEWAESPEAMRALRASFEAARQAGAASK